MWSHDGFNSEKNGYNRPKPNSNYCDQDKCWELLGTGILKKAWQGLNCTAFAYGQTGAGKSYSFFGYGANKGIIPTACTEIFKSIDANSDPKISFELTIQMVEIYMERILDLLGNGKKGEGL